jgi:hypothetical protein
MRVALGSDHAGFSLEGIPEGAGVGVAKPADLDRGHVNDHEGTP